MTDRLGEAALIALFGVMVVMAALASLMSAIMLITRLPTGQNKGGQRAVPEIEEWRNQGKEQAAVIAVSMALAMRKREEVPTCTSADSVEHGHGDSHWASAGRERLVLSRTKPGRTWGKTSR